MGTIAGMAGGVAAVAVGCGGDDTVVGNADGGNDSTAGDVVVNDVITQPDVKMPDGGPDALPDVIQVGDADAQTPIDAPPDAPPLGDFLHQVAVATCGSLRACCGVAPSKWDEATCEKYEQPPYAGFPSGVNAYVGSFDGGRVNYNPALAAQCLSDLSAISGSSATCAIVSSTLYAKLKQECIGAVEGTVPWDGGSAPNDAGRACGFSNECLPGGYCDHPSDGGASACLPLKNVNDPCTAGEQCTYLGLGTPPNYCAPDSGTCQPSQGLDAGCRSDEACQDLLCRKQCVPGVVFSDPGIPASAGGTCALLTLP